MKRAAAISLAIFACALCLAQPPSTYTPKVGAYPWHDRVNQWAISVLPEKYATDKPIPQQSCNARNVVLPAGTTKITLAVLDKQLAEFLEKQPRATDTGDKLEIKSGAATLAYAIVTVEQPEAELKHSWMSAGLILLALEPPLAAGTVAPTAPVQPAVTPAAVPQSVAAGSYAPANQTSPWHDRVGRWVINKLPADYANLPPVPQQSCEAKSLILPPGTKQVTVAVSDGDLAEFQKRFPQIKDTGQKLSIEPPGGGSGLPYSIVIFPDPPEKGEFRDFAKGGLVLLKVGDAPAAAAPTPATQPAVTGAKNVLAEEQEFAAQEWPIKPGERKVRMFVQEPAAGINRNTGLMLVLHNWGGVYNSGEYLKWCKTFADRYNVVAMSVNYLQSGQDWKAALPYDHGYLQAMDCLRALYTVQKQLKDKGIAFNERRVYSMGGSGGGNVTEMVMKLAPHTFACGVDICGMPGLIDGIAYGTGEWGTSLNAGYSKDPASPAYLSKDMQEIRDFGNLAHCRLLKAANPNLKIVIVHGTEDGSCPVVPKIRQYSNMIEAGLQADAHFLTAADVDGTVITTTGHAVGDREQVVVKFADEDMKETGKYAKAAPGPSDFTRGGTFEYPTSGGKYIIDFTAAPTIRFEGK
ncbi:MAG: DUF2920 family protein [Armatimonadia bacterium]